MHSLGGFHLRTGLEGPGRASIRSHEKYSQHKKHLRSKDREELPVAVTWAQGLGIHEAAAAVGKMVPRIPLSPSGDMVEGFHWLFSGACETLKLRALDLVIETQSSCPEGLTIEESQLSLQAQPTSQEV